MPRFLSSRKPCGPFPTDLQLPQAGATLAAMRILILSLLFASTLALPSARADRLTVGVSQYAASLNHLLEASVAQSYLLGMTTRPLTLYDAEWNLVCGLCTRLPSFENGLAQRQPLEGGGMGVAVTYELKPDLTWDDGTPVTAQDFKLAWEIGSDPAVGALVGEG